MSNHTEAQLLEAMAHATLPEQRKLSAELDELRSVAAFNKEADAENDLANAVITDHLTPVLVHGFHSTATDWLGEDVTEYTTADLQDIGTSMRAEASVWYSTVTEGVKDNRDELREQARGVARRIGSQYGEVANQASSIFMEYVGRLVTSEGTDLAGVPSAAGDNTNPNAEAWDQEPVKLDPADAGPQTTPTGADANPGAPEPSVSGPAPEEPSDDAPSVVVTLPEEDTHNNPGDAAATGQIAPAHATRYESAQQRAIREFLGTEEGQDFPVPGERDPEQDGEAASSLPVDVDVAGHPDTFDNFIPPTPSKPAPSTRAPQVQGAREHPRHKFQGSGGSCSQCGHGNTCECHTDHDITSSRRTAATPPCGNADKHGPHSYRGRGGNSICNGTVDESKTNWTPEHGWRDGKEGSRHTAITTSPNPQGSFVYDAARVNDKGYAEGYAYALTWSPGKPIPAALTSAAAIGNKYNAEYVSGYKNGVGDGIDTLSTEFKAAFATAHKQQVLSSRTEAVKREAHPFKAGTGICTEKGVEGEGVEPHCYWCNEHWNHPNHKASEVEKNRKIWASKTADANTRQFNDLDQEVAFPFTWSGDGGKGAADVGSVPTPGSSVADYPQPGNAAPAPSVGEASTEIDPIIDEAPGDANPAQVEAVRRYVRSRLGFSDSRQVTAEPKHYKCRRCNGIGSIDADGKGNADGPFNCDRCAGIGYDYNKGTANSGVPTRSSSRRTADAGDWDGPHRNPRRGDKPSWLDNYTEGDDGKLRGSDDPEHDVDYENDDDKAPHAATSSRRTAYGDDNWDTGEVKLWFDNDYGLYQATRGGNLDAHDIRELWEDGSYNKTVDVSAVDWQSVADDVNEAE